MRPRLLAPLALIAVLVLGGLLVFAIPRPAAAQHCANARVIDPSAEAYPTSLEAPGRVTLYWSYDLVPWPEDLYVVETVFRIDRRPVDAAQWETVATVTNDYEWSGPADPGRWIYRVSLVSLAVEGTATEQCEDVARTVAVDLPSAEELTETLLRELCGASEVIDLRIVRPEDGSLMLKWEDDLDWYYGNEWHHLRGDAPPTFKADTVVYRVQRAVGDADQWTTLAETTGRVWSGPAEPGRWTYRVGTVKMAKGSVAVDCDPWYAQTYISIQTAEEAAEQARQTAILWAESVRCATRTLTNDLQGEARQIVAGYVAERVTATLAEWNDPNDPERAFGGLVTLTVQLCAGEGPRLGTASESAGPVWTTLALLGIGDWDW